MVVVAWNVSSSSATPNSRKRRARKPSARPGRRRRTRLRMRRAKPGNQRPKRVRPPGAVVLQVDPQSAAERAGLKPGDLVTELDGTPVRDAADLQLRLALPRIGEVAEFAVSRRREEGRVGKLRIFVGAAPGVGKTYEMLQNARARQKDGYDIVIGVVETHGRKETEALLEGLEVVPRRRIDYKGQLLEEMDLDGIIARRPQIVLVDELAHTNAPGSRHPKRYLDVEELLNHGINVYTTVNIQHIESLNDVVAQITHVRVRETVPDSVFDRADAIELVDITPDDLIERLKEGKVYVPKQAERALE